MKKIVYTEPYHNSEMYIEYQKYRTAEGGFDVSDEWQFSHYTNHRDMVVFTKSGFELKKFKIGAFHAGKKIIYNYHATLHKSINWLLRCYDLSYRKDLMVICNSLGDDRWHEMMCMYLRILPDKSSACKIRPFLRGEGYATDSGGRPLPEGMKCDLKYVHSLLNYECDEHGFSLHDYWLCQNGDMRKRIEWNPE